MSRYIRHSIVSLENGLTAIHSGKKQKGWKGSGVSSLRLQTFVTSGTRCVYCGLQATHFAIEKSKGSQSDRHHMNLWGMKNGTEILFTHDHVHARALGGADDIENAVTACENCNSRKSKYENRILAELNRLKISVDFDGLVGIVKSLYQDAHVHKFWLIESY